MRATHLSLTDFRNYRTAELELALGPVLLLGRNGQGKTNLVEAIAYFAALRSHRVAGDSALIRAGAECGVVRLRVESDGREVLLEIELAREGRSRARINRNEVRPRELMRWFSSVLFAPEDLMIVRGEPSGRRRFLDDALIMMHPVATGALGDYERVVRQRNALLKSIRGSRLRDAEATLVVWDDQLVRYGAQIMRARRELIGQLRGPLGDGYRDLVGDDHHPCLELRESVLENVQRETGEDDPTPDVSRETLEVQFREALANVRGKELERGMTLVGPHRDDMLFSLNGLPVKGYASHGESWSFALSLKLALATVLREESAAGDPVIILDDVFAELDTGRRARLMSAVKGFEQVIVTAAVESDVPDEVPWNWIRVEAGEIREGAR